jgi:ATP-dependent Zn protease
MIMGDECSKHLVNEYWSVIENLAEILLKQEIIYADELDKLLAK